MLADRLCRTGAWVQAAAELLAEAVVEVESDGRLSQAGDLFRQAIGEQEISHGMC